MKSILQGLAARFRIPRGLRVTTPGKGFLALTLGVGTAAINTGNNLLYLAFSMNLSLIILSGVLSEGSIRGIQVEVRSASEAFAGRSSLLVVTVSAPGKRFSAFSLSATLGAPAAGPSVRFPEIPGGGSVSRVVPWMPPARGPVSPFSCTLSTRFPFGLFEKSRRVQVQTSSLLVYPAPGDPDDAHILSLERHPKEGTAPAGRSGPSVRGARDHMPADPVREIHWKASAKAGKWMVKEREAESDRVVEIRISDSCPESRFEQLLSAACGLVLRLERERRPYLLRLGRRTAGEPGQADRRRRALSLLARAEGQRS